MLKNKKIINDNLSIHELLIAIFPIVLLLGSFSINLYLLFLSLLTVFYFFKKKIKFPLEILLFIPFLLFIIINSFFSEYFFDSFKSSMSQIRFFLFSIFIINFLKIDTIFRLRYFFYFALSFVVLDVYFQLIFGFDIFGQEYDKKYFRLSGPFGDEYIVGFYIAFFSIITLALLKQKQDSKTYLYNIILSLFLICTVLITGERTSFLIIFFGLALLNIYELNIKKIVLLNLIILIFCSILFFHNNLFKERVMETYNFALNYSSSSYGRLNNSAISIWQKNKLTGVGNKNYRKICPKIKDPNPSNRFPYCSTHPHNYFLELMAETGLIGVLLFMIFSITIITKFFKYFKKDILIHNYIFYSSFILFLSYWWPIKTSGSIFTTVNGSYFWYIIGILIFYLNYFNRNKKI